LSKRASSSGGRVAKALLRRTQSALGCAAETFAELSSEAVFVVDTDRNVLLYSRMAEELTGIPASEVLGKPCVVGFRCAKCFEGCHVFGGGLLEAEGVEIFRKDGRSLRVNKAGTVIKDAAGVVLGAMELFSEVGGPIRPTNDRTGDVRWSGVDTALAALGRVALLVDRDMRLQRSSRSIGELLGQGADALVGRPLTELLGPDLFERKSPFRLAMEADERPEGWRVSVAGPEGPANLLVSGARIASECGGDEFIVVLGRDPSQCAEARPGLAGGPSSGRAPKADGLPGFAGMIGASPAMLRVFQLIEHLQASDATVLITGESGTGKELVAQGIHANSPRALKPFVAINCAALPSELLETELFGHVRGAFTGAVRDKVGRFEVAGEGTLFLDEIGDLPLPLQVKLLRVLQERVYERVGDTAPRLFRARVIAATHQDLVGAVAARRFREDLFYRLNVVGLHLPPLRERKEDLELLVTHLLDRFCRQHKRSLLLSDGALRALLSHDWPGNVRQLENALEFATTVCRGTTIQVTDLPPEVARHGRGALAPGTPPEASSPGAPLAPSLDAYPSNDEILAALRQCRNRRAQAAKLLGVSRTTLWRRLRELAGQRRDEA
jgi:transcriptional regulator with PAS, ATPase and Fis domain